MAKISRLAIANRGEVAVRIIRACNEMGIETVLLHSEADTASVAYRICDRPICIGPAPAAESYLDIEANISGALAGGAEAIHPGFGFLSENEDFARRCSEAGMIFVGPSPEAIGLLGDKIRAKKLVEAAGVPTIPGYRGEDSRIETLVAKAKEIGFPVIAKAAAGGGGRGMKIIRSAEEAAGQIESAQREALGAFGSDVVFLEKYLDRSKHIEVQVFVDATGTAHALLERECSVQRRHQKIVEEALSPSLTAPLREAMLEAAKQVAEAAKYRGAGTVEFLVQDDAFYFLEMNTRLQVEHPVTEMVLGVDLVKAQLMTAMGEVPQWPAHWQGRGHAIECRIYAEDPYKGGIPSTGVLGSCVWPEGPGRRFEVGFEPGDSITAYYDPMIAKLIVWDETRDRAIEKALFVLEQTVIFGVKTNIPFLKKILDHSEFRMGTMTTKFIEMHFPQGLEPQEPEPWVDDVARQLIAKSTAVSSQQEGAGQKSPWNHDWRLG